MSQTTTTIIESLADRIDIPADGTLSVTIHEDASCKVILFGFATGQELSEHTASMPAMMQLIQGQAQWKIGSEELTVGPGGWAQMAAHQPHSIRALEPTILLLQLNKAGKS